MSSVGISIHKEILEKKEQDYFLDFLSVKNFKYFFAITAITLISISPLIFHYLFKSFGKNALFNLSISFLFMLWIFSSAFALRFIFILPKIALNKKIKPYIKQMNHEGFQFLGLFVVVTIIFFIPSSIILSLQISLSGSNAQFFTFIKPLFDFVSFYISYFNYLIIFAAISYSYKIAKHDRSLKIYLIRGFCKNYKKRNKLAEGVRFELTVPCGTAVFKTAGLNHSPIPPLKCFYNLNVKFQQKSIIY
jgi:hypothetical protein